MTQENKERIVKYWNVTNKMDIREYESLIPFRESVLYNKQFIIAIQCSIAEVEAVIKAGSKYINEYNLTELQSQLAELKQLL